MIRQAIAVNLSTYRPSSEVYTIEADTGRDVVLQVVDYPLAGATAAVVAYRLPDGTESTTAGTIDTDENTVTAELDDAIIDVGNVPCQLRITEDGKKISSFDFYVRVLGGINA